MLWGYLLCAETGKPFRTERRTNGIKSYAISQENLLQSVTQAWESDYLPVGQLPITMPIALERLKNRQVNIVEQLLKP